MCALAPGSGKTLRGDGRYAWPRPGVASPRFHPGERVAAIVDLHQSSTCTNRDQPRCPPELDRGMNAAAWAQQITPAVDAPLGPVFFARTTNNRVMRVARKRCERGVAASF
jgi:hypothetical protein